jgi:hypothetical protein
VDFAEVKPGRLSAEDLKNLAAFSQLEFVRFARRQDGDALVAALARLPNRKLRSFSFLDVRLSENGFAALASIEPERCNDPYVSLTFWLMPVASSGLKRLRSLRCSLSLTFREVSLGEAEFEAMVELRRLERLTLYQMTRLAPVDFAKIRQMPISRLVILETPVGDELRELAGMPRLWSLAINYPEFDDASGRHLHSFPNLSRIELNRTSIGDATLSALGTLPKLTEVFVSHTRVTDEGLAKLALAPSLRRVFANSTAITPAGIARAQAIRPNLSVSVRLSR